MKLFGKLFLCLLVIALTGYLFLVDYPRLLESLNGNEESTYTSATEVQEIEETDLTADVEETADSQGELASNLEAQAITLEKELEQLYQQRSTIRVALCFDQISELVYSDIYPVLSSYGETGSIVSNNGWLIGDNGRIQTNEFLVLMEEGWSYVVGGDESLELSGTEDEIIVAWQTDLEEYMERIRVRSGVIPSVYCFREGEYLSAYEEILAEAGFAAILYFPEDAIENSGESRLQKVTGILLTEGSQADTLVETLQAYSGAVLVAQVVAGEDYEEGQITLESYLTLLEELHASDAVVFTTLDGAVESATDDEQSALRMEIQEKEAELKEIEAKLAG